MRAIGFCLVGLVLLSGCGKPNGKVFGVAPKGEPRSILAVKAGDTPPTVTVQGILVEKCPVAGCWVRLRDDSGVIEVDTKTAGFVVTEISLKTKLTVAGKAALEGQETILAGTCLRY